MSIKWINDTWNDSNGRLARSSFWNVAYRIIQELHGTNDNHWTNRTAWTNLYKIVPAAGGNPSGEEMDAQWPHCKSLFQLELKELNPKQVLIISGLDWAPDFFEDGLIEKIDGEFVEGKIVLNGSTIVIACRPEMKNRERHVKAVLEYFNSRL